MGYSLRQVALVEIVGADPVLHQSLDQLFHDVGAIVHPFQQHALVTQNKAGIGQPGASPPGLGRHLLGMDEMGVDPDRLVLFQHVQQIVGDPLGQHDRNG